MYLCTANALARKFHSRSSTIKTTLFNLSKSKSLKGMTFAYNVRIYSFRIVHTLSPRCSASDMFAISYVKSVNEHICSPIFSLLCRLEKSDYSLFNHYFHTIYYRNPMIKHWIDQLHTFNT